MSKHSKKRKHKKSPSSSREKYKKESRKDNHRHKRVKESVKSHEKKDQQKFVEEDARTSRHIKKPVYRLPKAQAAEEKANHKEERCTETKSVSTPVCAERISSEAKKHGSRKDKTVSGSKRSDKGPSKPVPQTEKKSKDGSDRNSSQGSPSKLKRQQMSPGLGVSKQESQVVGKKRRLSEEPQEKGNNSSTIKTWKTMSSSSKDCPQQKNREIDRNISKSPSVTEPKAKKSCKETKNYSASTSEEPSTSKSSLPQTKSSEDFKHVSASKSDTPVSQEKAQSSSALQILSQKFVPFKFKIPKKVRPVAVNMTVKTNENSAVPANTNLEQESKHSLSGSVMKKAEQEVIQPARSYFSGTLNLPSKQQDEASLLSDRHSGSLMKKAEQEVIQPARSCFSGTLNLPSKQDEASLLSDWHLPKGNINTEPQYDQLQVVEQLNLSRSERRLEITQSYGELTCMEIDAPEEGPTDSCSRQREQQDLLLILDTNILLSHLDYVKKIISLGLGALGSPVVLIPWVVLQELDSLKRGRDLSGSVAHLATPAISYIYNALRRGERRLWGQSMQQAAESSYGLNAENNDDRVLQCCLQYRDMHPECLLILCTNDKNLCSKALLSGVKAFCKTDLEAEVERCRHGQTIQYPILPRISPQVSSRISTPPSHTVKREVVLLVSRRKQLSKEVSVQAKCNLSRCLSELEECLQQVLSDVLEVEMKAAYEELWLEIVYIKPPWTLKDALQCLKKHWIAVFGHIAPRRNLEIVLNLINFFNSGEFVDRCATSAAIREAKVLLKAFCKSSNHVASAISVMECIFHKLQPEQPLSVKEESFACDVVMNDDEDNQLTSAQASHQETWALFEKVWSNLYQTSLEVFKALGFDPHTMDSAPTVGAPLPPQDALDCLHKLSSVATQLLQAFSSVLSSAPGLPEVQALLSIIHSNKIVNEDSKLTAKDLLDCFAQPDYREKLRIGGSQLMELKRVLDCCVWTTNQHFSQFACQPNQSLK